MVFILLGVIHSYIILWVVISLYMFQAYQLIIRSIILELHMHAVWFDAFISQKYTDTVFTTNHLALPTEQHRNQPDIQLEGKATIERINNNEHRKATIPRNNNEGTEHTLLLRTQLCKRDLVPPTHIINASNQNSMNI
jgi:hypothetical protein